MVGRGALAFLIKEFFSIFTGLEEFKRELPQALYYIL